jgi:hypothetical protein
VVAAAMIYALWLGVLLQLIAVVSFVALGTWLRSAYEEDVGGAAVFLLGVAVLVLIVADRVLLCGTGSLLCR